LIGVIGLDARALRTVVLGYWLGVPYWGRGLMSEAVSAIAAFGRQWRPETAISAHTFPENVDSQRVLEKAGFVRCGTGVCDAPARGGEVEDAPLFELAPRDAA
jgi:RimJ/RimL family protein N-acetyltransferase